jgi:nucleoside-diphosphate-sugar epimerase
MPSIYFTGFPGFLGSELLPRVLARRPDVIAHCLVQPKFAALANERALALIALRPELHGRIRIVEGDLTHPLRKPADDIVEIYHLAAVYDLAVERDFAMRVNVDGTHNVVQLAKQSDGLERLHYVSTCYVSGRHAGAFDETDLVKGQTFNNYYEETKYLAEVKVQEAMGAGLPATIYRPSVVVGDSHTGATQKFDGPYFVMQWLLRQPRVAVLPVVGNPANYRFNVVPRDFVIAALDVLSAKKESRNKVYQLADPQPLTVDETIDAIATATGRKVVRIPLPKAVAKGALQYVPGVYRLMRIPAPAVDYFVHPTTYGTANVTADLAGTGISAPRLRDYLPRLVEFVRAHPEIGSKAMV